MSKIAVEISTRKVSIKNKYYVSGIKAVLRFILAFLVLPRGSFRAMGSSLGSQPFLMDTF